MTGAFATGAGGAAPHQCRYCGVYHSDACPRVKAFEYHPDGSLKRVEIWSGSLRSCAAASPS